MAEVDVDIDVKTFWERLSRFYDSWKREGQLWGNVNGVVLTNGQPNDEVVYTKSTSMQAWFFGYEFTEAIMVFTPSNLFILTSAKKISYLEKVAKELNGELPPVPIELMTRKKEDNPKFFSVLIDALKGDKEEPSVGLLLKEKQTGEFVESWEAALTESGIQKKEISPAFSSLLSYKDQKEMKAIKTAATISGHILKSHLLPSIETVIDEEKQVTHAVLGENVDKLFDDPSKLSKKLKPSHIDQCYPALVRSGGVYDCKPGTENNEDPLHFGTIVCSVGARYKSYCSNIARTYFVDPAREHERSYKLLLEVQQLVIDNLKQGTKLSKLYALAAKHIESRKPELLPNFGKNVGFGMGLEFQEPSYIINAKNEAIVKSSMTFCISVTFNNIKFTSDDPKKRLYSLLISDTVTIGPNGEVEVLTERIPKKYNDISYFLETEQQEEEVEDKAKAKKPKMDTVGLNEVSSIVESKFRETTKLRAEEKNKMKSVESKRREHQRMLEERKREEAAARFSKEQAKPDGGRKGVANAEAYKDPAEYPKEANKNRIFVDPQRESVLVPIYGIMVPFHVSNIKNASKTDEEYLRINFNNPEGVTINDNTEVAFIREITYRCPDPKNLNNALRMIKELRKRVTARETERKITAGLIAQEKLVLSKNRVPRLSDIFVRPNPTGRRTTGVLEAHTNGFRFTSTKGEHIDIMYGNIKHSFFQPAENELIVLIHFHLHNAIMVGKKKTNDVQFCTEVMEVSQALDSHGKYDADELEDEQRERQLKARLNNEFQTFVRRVEETVDAVEFDIPYRDLGFDGVPNRSAVFLQPTVNCLVNLSEQPFFVLTLSNVEIASFERVQFSLKNFDLVFVLKDYEIPPIHINSIAVEHLETIKEWLDSCDIKYYEGAQTLNWNRIMATIREDPMRFHTEDGGWSFLNTESDAEGGEEEEEEEDESDFDPESDEEGVEDEEAEADDDEDDDEGYSDEDEDEDEYGSSEDEEDAEGEDWDEMEERARKEDKQAAEKRQKRGREDFSDDSDSEKKKVKTSKGSAPPSKGSSSSSGSKGSSSSFGSKGSSSGSKGSSSGSSKSFSSGPSKSSSSSGSKGSSSSSFKSSSAMRKK